jgi:AhpC/TSA family protein
MLQICSHLLFGAFVLFMLPLKDAAGGVRFGQSAPDFAVQSLDGGRTIRLSDFRGHRVLVFTWASW